MKDWLSFLHILLTLQHSQAGLYPSGAKPYKSEQTNDYSPPKTIKLESSIETNSMTLLPTSAYFNWTNAREAKQEGTGQTGHYWDDVKKIFNRKSGNRRILKDGGKHGKRSADNSFESSLSDNCHAQHLLRAVSTYDAKGHKYARKERARHHRIVKELKALRFDSSSSVGNGGGGASGSGGSGFGRQNKKKRFSNSGENNSGKRYTESSSQRQGKRRGENEDDLFLPKIRKAIGDNDRHGENNEQKNESGLGKTSAFSPSDNESFLRCKRRSYHGVGPPSFHPSSPANITAQLGASAYLPCRIRNLGNKSVSWFRQRDSHILTVDRTTFIADGRFSAWHETGTQSWTLHIRYVQARDAGIYECQVSTEPKMSHYVRLTILKPSASIAGETDQYVRGGSTVTLRCVISNAIEEPSFIFWYQNGLRVVQTASSNRVITASRSTTDTTTITLTIPAVTATDSGNYTCAPASIGASSVTLHVLNDEHPAAMQTGTTNAAAASTTAAMASLAALAVMPLTTYSATAAGAAVAVTAEAAQVLFKRAQRFPESMYSLFLILANLYYIFYSRDKIDTRSPSVLREKNIASPARNDVSRNVHTIVKELDDTRQNDPILCLSYNT